MSSNDSLIMELQQQALDASQSVTVLLRKALLVATKLDLADAVEWIEKELSGWQKEDWEHLPEWRKVRGNVVARNPYHGWQPVIFGSSDDAEVLSLRPIISPAAELEALIANKTSGHLQITYAPETELAIQKSMNFSDFPVRCEVGLAAVKRILEEIRNKILRWSLALEKAGIHGRGLSFTQDEKKQAHNVHINIYGGAANIGSIASVGDTENIVSSFNSTVQENSITEFVTEVTKYAGQLGLSADEKRSVDTILGELKAEAALPAPEAKKAAGLAKRLLEYVGKTANNVLEAGMKAYVEAWIKLHGGA